MSIQRLDHFTLRTPAVAATVAFYQHVIGLAPGPRPAFRFPGAWLYAGSQPVLHIAEVGDKQDQLEAYLGRRDTGSGSGCLDHVSLRGSELAATQQHLLALGQPFRERVVPEINEHQLFLQDPNGVTIELIFPCSPDDRIVGEPMPQLEIAP